MKIHVRRRHISNGECDTANYCPVAIALQDELGIGPSFVEVAAHEIILGKQRLKCPRRVARFIARFDAGKPVKPFAFVLK